MDRVRIGFVGVGGMGQCAHLRNYAALPDCEVVALAEIRPELARRVAARYAVPHVYRDHREMLGAEKLDGIVASQPFGRHGTLVPELLEAGVPVFTEKPLAGSLEQGQRILDALARGSTWHMVGYHKRCDPATVYAKAKIDNLRTTGELGALRYVRITMPPGDWIAGGFDDLITTCEAVPPLPPDPAPSDRDEAAQRQFVSFVNYYIHQVNLLRHLLGEPYEPTYADPAGVLLAAMSATGVTGLIEMAPYATTIDWQEQALVAFERGYVRISLPAPVAHNRSGSVEVYLDPGNGSTPARVGPTLPFVHAMRQQAASSIAAVRGDCPPPCTAPEAMEDLRVADKYLRLLGQSKGIRP